jgi:hypothetical protein
VLPPMEPSLVFQFESHVPITDLPSPPVANSTDGRTSFISSLRSVLRQLRSRPADTVSSSESHSVRSISVEEIERVLFILRATRLHNYGAQILSKRLRHLQVQANHLARSVSSDDPLDLTRHDHKLRGHPATPEHWHLVRRDDGWVTEFRLEDVGDAQPRGAVVALFFGGRANAAMS